jgi:hypothetical protein
LEDAGIPSRVIDELMGHESGRRTRDGSAIGPSYRHTTDAMFTRVRAAIEERLTVAGKLASDCFRSTKPTPRQDESAGGGEGI